MRHIFVTAYQLDSGAYSVWRSLTTIDFDREKQQGNIIEFYNVAGSEAVIHVGFENVAGSERDARRVAIHAWEKIRGKEELEAKQKPVQFIEQQMLPFDVIDTGTPKKPGR